jgi:N-acetylglucosaminyl-diphospho-decaprenol L-rhamnosyltransferase
VGGIGLKGMKGLLREMYLFVSRVLRKHRTKKIERIVETDGVKLERREMPKVSIIIPCLNHYDYTCKCLDSLKVYTDLSNCEIIIVDDGSNDQTPLEIHNWLQDVNFTMIRHHPTNLGFAVSCNHAIKCCEGDYIAICNNDFIFGKNWLTMLIDAIEYHDIEMVTSKLVGMETCPPHEFHKYVREAQDTLNLEILKWVKNGPWLFRREVFDIIGIFDERFKYGQYEDADLLCRMALAGMQMGCCVNSLCYHFGSVCQNGELKDRVGHQYVDDNRIAFKKKWHGHHLVPEMLEEIYQNRTRGYKEIRRIFEKYQKQYDMLYKVQGT